MDTGQVSLELTVCHWTFQHLKNLRFSGRRSRITEAAAEDRPPGPTHGLRSRMSTDLPAVIEAPSTAAGTVDDLLPMPASQSAWLPFAASPLWGFAGNLGPHLFEASLELLRASRDRTSNAFQTFDTATMVLVEAAADVAKSPQTPAAAKVDALRCGVRLMEIQLAAEEHQVQLLAAQGREGLLSRVLEVVGLAALAGLVFRASARR